MKFHIKYITLAVLLLAPYALAAWFWLQFRDVRRWQENASQVINNNAGVQNQIVEFLNRVAQPPQ